MQTSAVTPLTNVRVHRYPEKVHGVDSENPEQQGALTDEQRLLEIADKCPVHKPLSARSEINTALLPPA